MKITYFRLRGYVNILNGMGMDEIIIPFSEFKNRIVLISGENGTGKSSLVRAMTPDPDPNECFRTDVLVDTNTKTQRIIEYPAEKEIRYLDPEDGSEYRILIQSVVDSSRTKRTNKCYIAKNGEEFNPTGNVTLFKETRDSLMGINSVYLGMSEVSSENRGLVDMIPSERRKYLASYIGSLETYNEIFKNLSKKVSTCKSYMNTINSKMHELGNENELRLSLGQLESALKAKSNKRDELLKSLAETEATIKLLDPNNETQLLCESISDNLRTIKNEMEKNQKKLDSLHRSIGKELSYEECIENINSTSNAMSINDSRNMDNRNEINKRITLNSAMEDRLEMERSRLRSLTTETVETNIENVVADLILEIDYFKESLGEDKIKLFESISINDLYSLRNILFKFQKDISIIEEKAESDQIFIEALDHLYNDDEVYTNELIDINESIVKHNSDILVLENEIEQTNKNISILKTFEDSRPKGCTFDDCPYIAEYIELKRSGNTEDKLINLTNLYEQTKNEFSELNKQKELHDKVIRIMSDLRSTIEYLKQGSELIKLVDKLSYLLDINILKNLLKNHNRFTDFSIVTTMIEDASIYTDYKKAIDQMKSLEGDLKVYRNNKQMIDSLTESIEKAEKEYEERATEIKKIQKDYLFTEEINKQLSDKLTLFEQYKETLEEKQDLENKKQQLKDQFESAKEKIKTVTEKINSINSIKASITEVEDSMKPLNESINKINYSLTNIISYQDEYKTYSEKFEKLTFIRNACSPGNGMGIQSEFVKHYMNEIILMCNKVLSYMFSGTIQLDIPVINEKQFSIPFIGPGGINVPDISAGSTAQKCMIGLVLACVSMMKASNKYNIPRFDEVDAGLDPHNRIMFIQVMNQVLDIMESEQCIIISHNTEFDSQNTSRIICHSTGPEYIY